MLQNAVIWTMPAFTSVRLYVCSTIICTACTVMQEPAEPCIFTAEMKNMLEDSRRNPWIGLNCWWKLIRDLHKAIITWDMRI